MTIKQLKEEVDRLAATCHPLTEVRLGVELSGIINLPPRTKNGNLIERLEHNPQNSAINIIIK